MMQAFPPPVLPYVPELAMHIGGGIIGIITGYTAVLAAKGENLHRNAGTAFVAAMLMMAAAATYLAISLRGALPGQTSNIGGGIFAFYLVSTAYTAVKRKEGTIGLFEKAMFAVVCCLAAIYFIWGVQAYLGPQRMLDGYPFYFYVIFGVIAALMALADFRVIANGGITGAARIARHLWRMCFAFFFATGSFFLGQQKVMPAWMHGTWYLYVLGLAPLGFLVFWLIRVRLDSRFKSEAAVTYTYAASAMTLFRPSRLAR